VAGVLQSIHFRHRHCVRWLLAFCWTLGLISGICLYFALPSSGALMRGLLLAPVSIVWLFLSGVFPFLVSAFAVYISKPQLIFLISILKAFCFSFVALCLSDGFGAAGWLVRFFLLFHDMFIIPCLYIYWSRGLSRSDPVPLYENLSWFSLQILILCVEYRVCIPFLLRLNIL